MTNTQSKKVNNSIKRKRFLTQFFTYFYLILLSIIIIFPLLVTISSAFRPGNLSSFTFDLGGAWTLDNFKTLFNDTLYEIGRAHV